MLQKLTLSAMLIPSICIAGFDYHNAQSVDLTEQQCMALNIYHEARSESVDGQLGVAYVTLNRVHCKAYPHTICDVVFQNRQFSWTQDDLSDEATNEEAWKRANDIAEYSFRTYSSYDLINDGALFYHTKAVSPKWSKKMSILKVIDNHIFYKGNVKC